LHLGSQWSIPLLVHDGNFRRHWPSRNSASSAVVANPVDDSVIHDGVVHHDIPDVHIPDGIHIYPIDRGVVEEVAVIPVAAVVAMTDISIPVIHTTIETDM
jgi:hypothetical protein